MTNSHSTLRGNPTAAYEQHEYLRMKLEQLWPPAIPFISKEKKKKKKDGAKGSSEEEDKDEGKFRSFDIEFNPNDNTDESKFRVKIAVFDDGSAEEWCEWRTKVDQLIRDKECTTSTQRVRVYRSLLEGKALDLFAESYSKRLRKQIEVKQTDKLAEADETLVENQALNDVALMVFKDGTDSIRAQKRYLRNNLSIGNMDPEMWAQRLEKINRYLQYFPVETVTADNPRNKPLAEDELVDIMDNAKKVEWHAIMLQQGRKPHSFRTLNEAVAYYKRLYEADKFNDRIGNHGKGKAKGEKRKRDHDHGPSKGKGGSSNGKCNVCGSNKHQTNDCWDLDKNADKRPPGYTPRKKRRTGGGKDFKGGKKTNNKQSANVVVTKEVFNALMTNAAGKEQKGRGKRNHSHGSEDDSSAEGGNYFDKLRSSFNLSNDEPFTPYSCYPFYENTKARGDTTGDPEGTGPLRKKFKVKHYTAEIIIELPNREGDVVPIRAVLDTGTTSTIVLKEFVKKGRASTYKGKRVN